MDGELVWKAIEYAETCGLVVRGSDCGCDDYCSVNHVPLTIYPCCIKRRTFDKLSEMQLVINKLIHLASNDFDFINSTLSDLANIDEFWSKLVQVWLESRDSWKEPFSLGLHRSDYLIETKDDNQTATMVEFNTIASSMGGHAVGIGEMHRSIGTLPEAANAHPNNVLKSLVHGMATAVDKFCEAVGKNRKEVCVVVLREERGSRNFSDQKRVEIMLQKELGYQVEIHRAPFSAFKDIVLDESTGSIHFKEKEVALFYLRAGYDPNCYVTDPNSNHMDPQSWLNRLTIEQSRAIKSPPVNYHLLTNKRFQAEFSKKEVLTKFISDKEADDLLTTFCQLGDLDNFDSNLVREAERYPECFCLKILREGGAEGNLFGEEIIPKLQEMKNDEDLRKMYILMKKINPDTKENILVRCGKSNKTETISEVGIFGIFLHSSETDDVIINSNDGHLVRTKPAISNVGGVNVGGACIDSLYLI